MSANRRHRAYSLDHIVGGDEQGLRYGEARDVAVLRLLFHVFIVEETPLVRDADGAIGVAPGIRVADDDQESVEGPESAET